MLELAEHLKSDFMFLLLFKRSSGHMVLHSSWSRYDRDGCSLSAGYTVQMCGCAPLYSIKHTCDDICEVNDGRSVSGGLEIISGCVCGFLAVHIHIHIHTYIHAYMHTCMHTWRACNVCIWMIGSWTQTKAQQAYNRCKIFTVPKVVLQSMLVEYWVNSALNPLHFYTSPIFNGGLEAKYKEGLCV